jgi:hypothetical protein
MVAILQKIYNNTWGSDLFPNAWHNSFIVPIPKKGDSSIVDNFRCIALQSNIYKLLAMIVDRKWCSIFAPMSDFQFGCRQSYSTIDAAFTLNTLLCKYIDIKPIVVFVDFKAAFPSVHRSHMMRKLINRGIPLNITQFILNVNNTTSSVRWNNCVSDPFQYSAGVNQGDPLSPLLYALYIDDLPETLISAALTDRSKAVAEINSNAKFTVC